MTVKSDIERYRTNYLAEQEGSELYQSLAKTERDPHLAELYTHQIAVERQELLEMPEEEREELALIYEAKGIDRETANRMAERIMAQGEAALDTLAREELGIDPEELGGSAWTASIMSFMLFAIGAVIPVIPFVFGSGTVAVLFSLLLGTLGLFTISLSLILEL